MAAPSIQDLLATANCFQCLPPGTVQLVKLSLLAQILKTINPLANVNIQNLLADANCFACIPAGQQQLVELVLLADILVAGSVGGGVCLFAQSGAPVTPCQFNFGLSYDNDTGSATAGSFWFWDMTNKAWVLFLTGL